MAHEFIYQAYKLERVYPPDKTVLENISLSFYPGAKIGVIGSNGAGKSSLLKIMAGLDDGFSGRSPAHAGVHRRLPGQEPQLDPDKDVKGNVMDGVADVQSIIDEYNEVMAQWADPDADYDKIGKQQADPRRQDRRRRRLVARTQRRDRHGRAALPARRRRRHQAVGRRAAPRRAVPPPALAPRPAAARRADQPPRRRVGLLARTVPAATTPAPSSRSPTTATSSTTWPSGSSNSTAARGSRSRATTRRGSSRSRSALAQEERGERRPPPHARSASSNGCGWRRRPARRRARPASPPTRSCSARPEAAELQESKLGDRDPAGPPSRRHGDRGRRPEEGLRRQAAHRRPVVHAAAGRHRRHHRRRTAPARPPCSACWSAGKQPDAGDVKIGDTVQLSYVDQSRDDLDADETVYEEITGGRRAHEGRRPRDPRPGLRGELQLQGHRSAEAGRQALGRRAQPCAPGEAAQVGRQRAAARRADQRPRRRHAACARGGTRIVPGLRRGDQPRPLVPRPHRHPRAGVRR